jgi:HTTM domain
VTVTEAPPTRAASGPGRWLLAAAPPTRLAALRVLIGGYCVIRLLSTAPSLVQLTDLPDQQFVPVGVLSPLRSPPAAGLVVAALVVAVAAGLAFVLGWRWRLSGPLFAVLFFLLSTYRVSWGHVSHADHLPALQLLLCGIVPAADAWSLDARRRRRRVPEADARYGWPIKVLGLITVVTYVLAGVAKLRYGGMGWLDGDVLRNQIAADALQKTLLGATHSPLVGWVTSHGWVLAPSALVAVTVELAAPVALLGGRWRDAWVASAWLLHVAIAAVMAITFPYPLCGVAFAPFYDLERGVAVLTRRWRHGDTPAEA